jgi:hypothetical protein
MNQEYAQVCYKTLNEEVVVIQKTSPTTYKIVTGFCTINDGYEGKKLVPDADIELLGFVANASDNYDLAHDILVRAMKDKMPFLLNGHAYKYEEVEGILKNSSLIDWSKY